MVDCHCVQPLKSVYGMPVLLTIKLIPKSGELATITMKQISKYHEALESILQAISENINVQLVGLFECKADPKDYYLALVVVRSFPGYDTKEAIKPFLKYMDKTKISDMNIKRTTYSVRLTSRIRLWEDYNITHSRLRFEDLETKVYNHTLIFSDKDIQKVYKQKFQVLTPLLYCKQIQLNDKEYTENDERLATLLTPRSITLSYYNRLSATEVRVCADHYMEESHHNTGNNFRHSTIYTYICLLLIFSYGTFHVKLCG